MVMSINNNNYNYSSCCFLTFPAEMSTLQPIDEHHVLTEPSNTQPSSQQHEQSESI